MAYLYFPCHAEMPVKWKCLSLLSHGKMTWIIEKFCGRNHVTVRMRRYNYCIIHY